MVKKALLLVALMLWSATGAAWAADRFITLASTTSTQNSGLFDHILPLFTRQTGITVRVIAVGTGQALRLGQRGDADVLLVHDTPSEEAFVAAGYGVFRRPVMYNDFVLIGPRTDPAGVRGMRDIITALRAIAAHQAVFVSRGDDSGTHKRERRLWRAAGINISAHSGTWYREAGAGMGQCLAIATGMKAYVLSDRATWLAFRRKTDLGIVVEGDPRLYNQYGVILVKGTSKPADSKAFITWLTSPPGQSAIGAVTINGQRLFTPNAP